MGYNYSGDWEATKANSPHLFGAHGDSVEAERESIGFGAKILRRFGFASSADKLVDSYGNPHVQVDASEGYTAENRTRVVDRLMGVSERVVLFPKGVGNVIQLELHNDGHIGFCVSDEPVDEQQARKKYSLDNFSMGIDGLGFGIPAAKSILDGTQDNISYEVIKDKESFDRAVGLAYRIVTCPRAG